MKVTIGLPVYNAENYIEDCIISILNQSYTEFKLLIIDDGSTDNSIEIIKKFKDNRIQLIVDGDNKALASRLNQIAELCETKYLVRMDADDIMHKDRIKRQIEILDNNPDIDVLGTNCYTIDDKNKIIGTRYKYSGEKSLKIVNSFIHPTIIAKTTWYLENPYDTKIRRSQDAELWERTREKSVFKSFTEPLLFYREFGGSYYKKYWVNLKSKGVILSNYFRGESKSKFVKYFFSVYIKAAIVTLSYTILSIFNKESLLINLRSVKLKRKDRDNAARYLLEAIDKG